MKNKKDNSPLSTGNLGPATALAILRAEVEKKEEKPTDGFRTPQEWADAWDLSREHALKLLSRGVAAGIVEERYFRVKCSLIVRKVRHFKITGKVPG